MIKQTIEVLNKNNEHLGNFTIEASTEKDYINKLKEYKNVYDESCQFIKGVSLEVGFQPTGFSLESLTNNQRIINPHKV